MKAFAIKFAGRRYLARNRVERPVDFETGRYPNSGWREFIWTDQLIDAEKFMSEANARFFANFALAHDRYEIVELQAVGAPLPLGIA